MNNLSYLLCRVKPVSLFRNYQKIRQLYSSASIGVEDYIAARKRYDENFELNASRFRKKMQEVCRDDAPPTSLIFTEDLKQMVHIAKDNSEDVELVEKMLSKFHAQNSHLRFGSYVFGPVVMRMFHYLNKPDEALKAYKDDKMNGFFDQLSSHIVLMDLLFNNKMYYDVIDVYKIMVSKQLSFGTHPKSVMVLVFGAYYKLNTPEHYDEAVQLFNKLNERGHSPLRRVTTFMAALALNQNNPHLSLEIISTLPNQLYVLVRCIKALALCNLDRIEDAISVIKTVLKFDAPIQTTHTFPSDVIEKVGEAVEKSGSKQLMTDYDRICKQLKAQNHIVEKTLDDLLCSEVVVTPSVSKTQTTLNIAMDNTHANHKKAVRNYYRPGLEEAV
ncbi:pentatricopeptide repeat-containing protein 2, mitochondrial-like [Planococcus citri]|uniref:pentatricopeptide repeat-containing protein 2, mitochondrial-like n=1 Tax=Planococcus citri TaxID=170843 RepID=UPI0031F9C0D0